MTVCIRTTPSKVRHIVQDGGVCLLFCRGLKMADTVASVIGLLHIVTGGVRYTSPHSEISWQAQQHLFSSLMLPHAWQAACCVLHRLPINSAIVLNFSIAATAIYRALAARTTLEQPIIAILLNTLHSAAFIVQQAMFVVPFRWAILLQSVGISLLWSSQLPCVLPAYQNPTGASTAVCAYGLHSPAAIATPSTVDCQF